MPSAGNVHEYVQVTFAPGQPVHIADSHAPPFTDTSTPVSETLSLALPLIIYGSDVALLNMLPLAGSLIVDVGMPASAVVYEKA